MTSQFGLRLSGSNVTGQDYYPAEAERQADLDEFSTDDLPAKVLAQDFVDWSADDLPSKMMSEELINWSTPVPLPDIGLDV